MSDQDTATTATAEVRNLRFRGHGKDGVALTGRVDIPDLPAWVQERWRRGWRSLTVSQGEQVVARIEMQDDGSRTWWADGTHDAAQESAVPLAEALAPYAAQTAERKLAREQAAGLRRLANLVEEHHWLAPLLRFSLSSAGINVHPAHDDQASQAAALARLFLRAGAVVTKDVSEAFAYVLGQFDGVKLKVLADREAVCQRVVVGTETVTKTIKDPAAVEALPDVEVTEEVEQVEWRCSPLLAGDREGGAS